MKLNNLDDFTKNNWYITTPASTIIDQNNQLIKTVVNTATITDNLNSEEEEEDGEGKSVGFNLLQLQQQQQQYQQFGSTESPLNINKIIEMPATTTTTTTTTTAATTSADVLAVEELVHEIKENLRLKARPSSQHHHGGRSSRPSPYHIPCRSWNDQQNYNNQFINNDNHINYINSKTSLHNQRNYNNNNNNKKEQDIDDPYELLQTLLKSKNLVKEAVRRLQLNSISPKQRSYFYESDDESRSPMFRMCQLEL